MKKKVETRKKVKCVYVKKGEGRSEKGEKNKKVFVCVCVRVWRVKKEKVWKEKCEEGVCVSEKRKSEKNEKKVNKGREKCVRVGEKG